MALSALGFALPAATARGTAGGMHKVGMEAAQLAQMPHAHGHGAVNALAGVGPLAAEGAPQSADAGAFLGGVAAGCAASAAQFMARRRRLSGRSTARIPLRADAVALVKTPKSTFEAMVEKGEANAKMSTLKTLHASIMGGAYVGMAGLLSLAISGNLAAPGAAVPMGLQKMVFAALFPVNLLLVLQSGCQLFTGNTATMSMGLFEGKVTLRQLLRSWILSYAGNIIGCGLLALVASYTGLLSLGTSALAIKTVLAKCSATFGQTVVKAIMCNWLVCMAVFLATSANDLAGKMVGIWFPISMFVAIGFEHSVANMFLLPAGLLAGAPLSLGQVLLQNLIPATIGNAIAGSIVIGAGFSYSVGRLGSKGKKSAAGEPRKEKELAIA